jgi:signal peptidase II
MPRKSRVFWPVALCLLLADCASKRLVVEHLGPSMPHDVLGSTLRFTLAYNQGTVFGFLPGPASRVAVIALTTAALVVLLRMYRHAPAGDRASALALGLIVGGALGNLADRVRSAAGVVDFIDAGAGASRFWIFNVADVGVTVGAVLLALVYLRRAPDGETPASR